MKKSVHFWRVAAARNSAKALIVLFLCATVFGNKAEAQITVPVNTAPKTSFSNWYYASNVSDATDPASSGNPVYKVVTNYSNYAPGLVSPAIPITSAATSATLSVNFSTKSAMSYNVTTQISVWYYVSSTQVSNSSINWNGINSSTNSKTFSVANTTGSWKSAGAQFTNVTIPAGKYLYVMITGDGTGSDYYLDNVAITLSGGGTSLNVQYAQDLTATVDSKTKNVQLSWSTASEVNDKGFQIERSGDNGKTWADLNNGFVASKAVDGNSSAAISYSFSDESPLSGTNTYRLKQVDLDGVANYSSKIVTVQLDGVSAGIVLYPNPVTGNTVYLQNAPSAATCKIINIAGQSVRAAVRLNGNSIDVAGLSSGIYLLQITTANGKTETLKLIKK